jgi:hypothetical protein
MLPVTIAPPASAGGLTLFPLIAATPPGAGYDLLPDALDAGTVVITEVNETGSVRELLATSRGPRDVLILDGMQLIGAMQNRTVGRTILLAAGTTTRVPVSCMEQGRWREKSRWMRSGRDHSPARVRRQTRNVEATRTGATPEGAASPSPADLLATAQGDVWAAIRESSGKLGACSDTGALDHVYEANRPRLEGLAPHFPAQDGQVGFIAFLGPTPVGADLVDDPATYARLHEGLVRGYLLDALEAGSTSDGVTADAAAAFLHRIASAERRPLPTVGRGDYQALTGDLVGGELTLAGAVVHLSAFPADWT